MFLDDLLFHLFPTFAPLPCGLKSTRLDKVYILTRKFSVSEVNFSPIWRNNLGYLLLDTMADSPVYFKIITNIISSNPSTLMVFHFFCSSTITITVTIKREENGTDNNSEIPRTE